MKPLISLALFATLTCAAAEAPRTYLFTVTYFTANNVGEVIQRQQLTGEYTRGLPARQVVWKNVAQSDNGGPAQKREFMEGFRYTNNLAATFQPDFFKAFPPTAVFERNLVWDTGMFEHFGQNFLDRLQPNKPYQLAANQDINMPDVGTFRNKQVVLEWMGNSNRNGQDCFVIQYQAFFNPLEIVNAAMNMKGRSDFWGDIWVSKSTRQIEYATIYENVAGEMKLANQDKRLAVSVFRIGTFEPLAR